MSSDKRTRRTRRIAGVIMIGLAGVAAVISYQDGLFLIRYAGAEGWVVYLYPLLPDGLIVVSWASLFEAAATKAKRPKWAMVGLILGAGLTVAMNVAAGAAVSPLLALADGCVPVVFFVALEVLIGLIRRAQSVPARVPARPRESVRDIRAKYKVSQATAGKMRAYADTIVKATSNGHGNEGVRHP
jgi:hypothetical protein